MEDVSCSDLLLSRQKLNVFHIVFFFLLPFSSQTESSPWTTAALWKTRKQTRYRSSSLLPAVCQLSHFSLQRTNSSAHTGHALRGKAQHICERHHKLRHIPLQPRHLPAHRHRLPEESAGHVVVSGTSCHGGAEGVMGRGLGGRRHSFFCFGFLHLSFFLPPIVMFVSDTRTMGKLLFFGLHYVVGEHWVSGVSRSC